MRGLEPPGNLRNPRRRWPQLGSPGTWAPGSRPHLPFGRRGCQVGCPTGRRLALWAIMSRWKCKWRLGRARRFPLSTVTRHAVLPRPTADFLFKSGAFYGVPAPHDQDAPRGMPRGRVLGPGRIWCARQLRKPGGRRRPLGRASQGGPPLRTAGPGTFARHVALTSGACRTREAACREPEGA